MDGGIKLCNFQKTGISGKELTGERNSDINTYITNVFIKLQVDIIWRETSIRN